MEEEKDFIITPWEVKGKVDYDKLIRDFGTSKIDDNLKNRLFKLAKDSHVMLKRNFFFSHRDLDLVLDDFEAGKSFFLYTGRGPSGPMHLGHLLPLIFTKWLQEKFNVNLYIAISDDEKFALKNELSWKEIDNYSKDNILDIIALGFDKEKTFIFRDSLFIGKVYNLILSLGKKITLSTQKAVFGFKDSTNISMLFYPIYQIVPTFFEKKRCLIPSAIDQDPYWRIQRDIAESFGFFKAAAIHCKFLPPLTSFEGKMSSSIKESAIWLTDNKKEVEKKIKKYAFSGGRATVEEHRKYGGNPEIDVAFQWLYILFEPDDKRINEIEKDYRSGKLLSGELKQILIDKINDFLEIHRSKREESKDLVNYYMFENKLSQEMWNREFII